MSGQTPRRGVLRNCPECGGHWPVGPNYELRGCGWLSGLSRNVTPSNKDVLIHDGSSGRDRFLNMELKRPGEVQMAGGQAWTLGALSTLPNWTVLTLRGTTRDLHLSRVRMVDGAIELVDTARTYAEAVRRAVDAWLRGSSWSDAAALLVPAQTASGGAKHTCGWARVDGVWTCIGDHYAAGHVEQAATSCGATLPEMP